MRLDGVHAALATPLDDSGDLDPAGLRRLLARIIDAGISTVCPTGSTGEGPRLARAQRSEVLAAVRQEVPDGTVVVPAPSGQNANDVIEELETFAKLGADAALVAAPSYFPMSDTETLRFYVAVADAAPLPLLIYNIPPMTGVSVPPDVVGELARHPNVRGIKDSSRALEYLQAVVIATGDVDDFTVLTGSDTMLLASLVIGAHGAIAASVNLVPELAAGIYANVQTQDWPKARQLQSELFEVVQACRIGTPPAGWKAALAHVGVCSARPVAPAESLDAEQHRQLALRLTRLGLS